jgi:hypothetical protein
MLSVDQVRTLAGCTAYDASGSRIGRVGQVYTDVQTGLPGWCTVNTGLFGVNESFVPLAQADLRGDRLVVPYAKDQVKDAPNLDPASGHLSKREEAALYRHYGLDYRDPEDDPDDTGYADLSGPGAVTNGYRYEAPVSRDAPASTTDDAMTRAEKQVLVGTEQPDGRNRLRKYVVTEDVPTTVPVSHGKVGGEPRPDGQRPRE